jgi:hypothetical protein
MATYKTNIGACQNDTVTTGYLTNIGADQTDAGPVGPTYVDAECTVTCTSSLVITAEVLEIIDATITITCTSTITISVTASLRTEQMKSRLIVIGNNQLWYEDI